MRISRAEVREKFDPRKRKNFLAKIECLGQAERLIHYTTPYFHGESGFTTPPPEPGVLILVVQPEGTSEWYYMASIPLQGLQMDNTTILENDNNPALDAKPTLDDAGSGNAETIRLQGTMGAGLEITNTRAPKAQNIGTKLYTAAGKQVILSDSRGIDAIILDNGSKTGVAMVTVGGEDPQTDFIQANGFEVKTTGPQDLVNLTSQTNIVVKDGRELQLINNSLGTHAPGENSEEYGNVNIQSKYKDLNLISLGESGRIFIECLNEAGNNQTIEIQTHGNNGVVRIITKGKVDIVAENVGIEASNNIDLRAGNQIRLQGGSQINVLSSGNVNIDGAFTFLNSGKASPANPNTGDSDSHYPEGITTY